MLYRESKRMCGNSGVWKAVMDESVSWRLARLRDCESARLRDCETDDGRAKSDGGLEM